MVEMGMEQQSETCSRERRVPLSRGKVDDERFCPFYFNTSCFLKKRWTMVNESVKKGFHTMQVFGERLSETKNSTGTSQLECSGA